MFCRCELADKGYTVQPGLDAPANQGVLRTVTMLVRADSCYRIQEDFSTARRCHRVDKARMSQRCYIDNNCCQSLTYKRGRLLLSDADGNQHWNLLHTYLPNVSQRTES